MFYNLTKSGFTLIVILSTLITISSNNWLGMWIGLEMNLMSFIPLISSGSDKSTSQAMMIYFLIQSVGSVTILFATLLNTLIVISPIAISFNTKMVMMMGLFLKVGIAPFHMWFPEMMSNLNWSKNFILMTWQSVAPLVFLNNIIDNSWFVYTIILFSAFTSAVGGLNQTSLRKIMAYSSINHMSWVVIMMTSQYNWYIYLMIYTILIGVLCVLFMKYNIYFMNQLNSMNFSLLEKMILTSSILSLGGLPPFIGFLPKWMVIQSMISSELMVVMLFMMINSLFILFYYLRMLSPVIMNYSTMNSWMPPVKINSSLLKIILTINLSLPLFTTFSFF